MSEFGEPYITTETQQSSGCSCVGWGIGFFIVLILFLVALGLLIWLFIRNRNDEKKNNNFLTLTNPKIEVTSNTSIKGTWDSTDSGNKVTLYASTQPLNISKDGVVNNDSTSFKSESFNQSGTGPNSVSITNLSTYIKYYATLIVTNANTTSNYQIYSQIVFLDTISKINKTTTPSEVTNPFALQNILQVGRVYMTSPTDTDFDNGATGAIVFNQAVGATGESAWFYNNNSQIQLKPTPDVSGLDNVCIVNNNGVLIAQACTSSNNNPVTGSVWTYNPFINGATGYANQWCLTDTLKNTTPTCMSLSAISAAGQAQINASTTTNPGDAWVNAFDTVPQ